MTKSLDRANVLTAMAGELNRVALISAAFGEREASAKVGFEALRFACIGLSDAPYVETRRRAILERALADVWIKGSLQSSATLDSFCSTEPSPETMLAAFTLFQNTSERFKSLRSASDSDANRLLELAKTFAQATLDAYLKASGGDVDKSRSVLQVFLQHPSGLFSPVEQTEIQRLCKTAGLDHTETESELTGLRKAGVLENPNKPVIDDQGRTQGQTPDRTRYGVTLAISDLVRAFPGLQGGSAAGLQ